MSCIPRRTRLTFEEGLVNIPPNQVYKRADEESEWDRVLVILPADALIGYTGPGPNQTWKRGDVGGAALKGSTHLTLQRTLRRAT